MSKPTRESVPWTDVVEAAKMVGIDPLSAEISLGEACNQFADRVDEIAAAAPQGQEPDLNPLAVDVYNNVIIFKVPVIGHPSAPAVEEKAVTEGQVDAAGEGVVEAPLPESTKSGKTAAEKAVAKAAKEKEKAEKTEAKTKEKADKKAAKEVAKASKVPGEREKGEGFAAVLRAGILAKEPEGVVIQKAYDAYLAKGIPADKDEKWALARAKRTYHYIYAELVKQGRMEPKPKPEPKPKKEKEEVVAAPVEGEAAAAPEGEATEQQAGDPTPTTE